MVLRLHGVEGDYASQKILIAAQINGIDLEFSTSATELRVDEMVNGGALPILETDSGFIAQSNAILRLVGQMNPETGLCGDYVLDICKYLRFVFIVLVV
jgi:hypothetical protein